MSKQGLWEASILYLLAIQRLVVLSKPVISGLLDTSNFDGMREEWGTKGRMSHGLQLFIAIQPLLEHVFCASPKWCYPRKTVPLAFAQAMSTDQSHTHTLNVMHQFWIEKHREQDWVANLQLPIISSNFCSFIWSQFMVGNLSRN